MFCVFIFLNCHYSINNQLNLVKNINLLSVFNGFCWIRIRIQGIDRDSTDPDPQHCQSLSFFWLEPEPL